MKNNVLLLLFLLLLSISCENKFSAEDQLWECMISEYDDLGIDIEAEVALYEQFLVEENYLENHAPSSYLELFRGFTEIGDIVPPLQNERYANVLQTYIHKGYTTACADSALFKQTRIFDMQQRAAEVLETAGDIQPNLLSETIVSVYSEEDMEHPLYRYTILAYLQAFVDTSEGISRQLPPASDGPTVVATDRNRIDIALNDKDELFFEGKPMELKNLRVALVTYLNGSETNVQRPEITKYQDPVLGEVVSSKAVVRIANDRMTSYQMYISVQNEVIAAFTNLRNTASKKYYGMSFDSLSEEQQNKIKEIVPIQLSEATPE